jgi:methylated-DNA-[protein]-cysteine S-methyltransferase
MNTYHPITDKQTAAAITDWCHCPSPIGPLLLAGTQGALSIISFPGGKQPEPEPQWRHDETPFAKPLEQLQAYFKGERQTFELTLSPIGTPFQHQVWQALLTVPFGRTCSYGDIARQIDNPGAMRAVGNANSRNPIPIIIPCHRVIGSDGSLTGFGGGLPTKQYLLHLEDQQQLCLNF